MKLFLLLVTAGCVAAARRKVPARYILDSQGTAGPNTCAVEYVPELGRSYYTEWKYWLRREVCGFKTQIHYECCEGYARIYGRQGCSGVLAMRDVFITARAMGAGLFIDYISSNPAIRDAIEKAAAEGAVTLLAPSDEAIRQMSNEQRYAFENNLHRNIMYHVLAGRVYLKDLPDADSTLKSLDSYGTPLRVSKFSNSISTVNCHLFMRRDHRATNGVVHVIDGVLNPPSSQDTNLLTLLSNDHRFSELYRLVSQNSEIIEILRDPKSHVTLLAPSNEAFLRLDPADLQRLQHDYTSAKNLLQLHVVPHAMCVPAVLDKHRVRTLSEDSLNIGCDKKGVYIQGYASRFTQEYHFANNGFLSVVSKVLLPNRIRSVWEVMSERKDLSVFSTMVHQLGMEHYVRDNAVTVFAPSNDAIRQYGREHGIYYDQDLYRLLNRDFVANHIVYGKKLPTSSFIDGKAVVSFERYSSIRMKVSRRFYGVDLSKIIEGDINGNNGVLHIIDKVLTPRRGHVTGWLSDYPYVSKFNSLVRRARSVLDEFATPSNDTTYTIFAPQDDAFEGWDMEVDFKQTSQVEKFVRSHIVPQMIPATRVTPNMTYIFDSESNSPVKVQRNNESITLVNGAKIIKADALFEDGVVYSVDKVLVKKPNKVNKKQQ